MIMTVSRAAFSDTTSNDGNLAGAGSVVLYNDAPNGGRNTTAGDETGNPMFGAFEGTWTVKADNLTPGVAVDHCIEIIYGGSIDAAVNLDSITSDTPSVRGFRQKVNVTIEQFAGSCGAMGEGVAVAGGTLASPTIQPTAEWTAAEGDSMFYLVELEVDASAGNEYQGASVTNIDFEWLADQA